MAQHTRSELYKIYKGGFHDKAFEHLVDSALNIKDDGLGINPENGLVLTAKGPSKHLLSFYQRVSDKSSPLWNVSLDSNEQTRGLNFNQKGKSVLFLKEDGNVGINTVTPNYELEVNGLISTKGILGSYSKGYCPADGKWHTLENLRNLDGCVAFEVFAHINDDKDRRYGLTYATLLMTHSKRGFKNKLRTVEAGSKYLFGRFLNKIRFKWILDDLNSEPGKPKYMIQLRTRTHYGMKDGDTKDVFYRVRLLWNKEFENDSYPNADWQPEPPASRISSPGIQRPSNQTSQAPRAESGPKKLTIKKR